MIKFETRVLVKDYYDQLNEGVNLLNSSVVGIDGTRNATVLKTESLNSSQTDYVLRLSDLVDDLSRVEMVTMICFIPQQYENTYEEAVPISILWEGVSLGQVSTFTMFGLPSGLSQDVVFSNPVIPDGATEVVVKVFVGLKAI